MPQSYSCILLHVIFSTKNREPLIKPDMEPELYAYMSAILNTNKCPSLAIGGTDDHVHLLVSQGRTKSVADVVEELKADSSRWIKTKGAHYSRFYWQEGYGVFSIGQSNVDALKTYIANQKRHHKKETFQEEFRRTLDLYGIQYDERYLWK